jgi:hypothetical protein
MEIQTMSEKGCIISPVVFDADPQTLKPLQVFPNDFGFEIDEEQLAAEMLVQVLSSPVNQMALGIDMDEVESIYG